MDTAFSNVEQLLNYYFDGLYCGDIDVLQRVFHREAHYVTASSGELVQLNMDEYFSLVEHRPSPASQQQRRQDKILSIELLGAETALARVECAIYPKKFTDLLNLILVDGRWQIISKVFHYQLIEEDSCQL